MDSYSAIYALVDAIPEGCVATYGQIARLIGRPRHARHVGYALAATPAGINIPWHRVVNARGQISPRRKPGYDEYQRLLLEEEGIVFDAEGRVSLTRFQWRPEAARGG